MQFPSGKRQCLLYISATMSGVSVRNSIPRLGSQPKRLLIDLTDFVSVDISPLPNIQHFPPCPEIRHLDITSNTTISPTPLLISPPQRIQMYLVSSSSNTKTLLVDYNDDNITNNYRNEFNNNFQAWSCISCWSATLLSGTRTSTGCTHRCQYYSFSSVSSYSFSSSSVFIP